MERRASARPQPPGQGGAGYRGFADAREVAGGARGLAYPLFAAESCDPETLASCETKPVVVLTAIFARCFRPPVLSAYIVIGILAAAVAALLLIVRVIAGPGEPIPHPSRRRIAGWVGIGLTVGGVWVAQALLADPAVLPPCPANTRLLTLVMEANGTKVRIDHYEAFLPDGSTLACGDDTLVPPGR